MYKTIATTGEWGLDVRSFDSLPLAMDCYAMLRDRRTTKRAALYQGDNLLVAHNRRWDDPK